MSATAAGPGPSTRPTSPPHDRWQPGWGEAWLTVAAIFAVALAVRAITAAGITFPIPEDTTYYWGVARNLVEGRGLVTDAIWTYHTPPLVFPRPAFEIWLPFPTFLAAIPMAIFGTGYDAASVASVLVGTIVPVLAWRVAADVAAEHHLPPSRARTLAVGAGLTAAVYLPLVLHGSLLDSTALFTVFAVGACLLMVRLRHEPRGARLLDARLLGLGVMLGLGALTRNEVLWLALVWAALVVWPPLWRGPHLGRVVRLRLLVVPAVIALAIVAPWLVRNWVVFGNPLPGQAIGNALYVTGYDVFAWADPPTLSRYLAQGLPALIEDRVIGLAHNLVNVLLFPGFPVALIGLVALPWSGQAHALRPLVLLSLVTFLVTALVFPVTTTWGTFLHGAGPAHVLLVVSAGMGLDRLIVRIGRVRGWTRPVAWLGPTLAIGASLLMTLVVLPAYGVSSRDVALRYSTLAAQFEAIGEPLDTRGPVITNYPIFLAEAERVDSLALPAESPESVLDLAAAFPGTRTLIVTGDWGRWPAILDADEPGAECFHELELPDPDDPAAAESVADTRVFDIACP